MDEIEVAEKPGWGWLDGRLRRVPPEAWPFVLIAGLLVAFRVHDVAASGGWLGLSSLILAGVVAEVLLPLAVLVGRSDAWRSARLILVGVVIWTLIPLTISVLLQVQQWLVPQTWPDGPQASPVEFIRRLTVIASIAGPAIVAIGLERRRRTETTWPKALVGLALLVTAGLCVFQARNLVEYYGSIGGAYGELGLTLNDQLGIAAGALLPVAWLAMGVLAWSTVSAVRAGEEPRRFWLLICAGSTLVFSVDIGVEAYALVASAVASGFISSDTPAIADTVGWVAAVASLGILAGYVLLLIGFGRGLPADPRDLGDVAADESAP